MEAEVEPRATAVVLAGGTPVPARRVAAHLRDWRGTGDARPLVVAADAGAALAAPLGLAVDVVVGDLDSVAPEVLAAVEAAGAEVERHPAAKDETDLELALAAAVQRGARRIVVVGTGGGRADHWMAGMLLLAAPAWSHVDVEAVEHESWVGVAQGGRPPITVRATVGPLVTLVPVHGPARGVRTTGLAYPLHGEDLPPGTTRGVSNRLTGPEAQVELASGSLLVVQPWGASS